MSARGRARQQEFRDIQHSYYKTTSSGHGRIEIRQYWSVPVSALGELATLEQWSGLKSVGIVVCERRLWNKTTVEVRFYISSLENNAQVLADAVRRHWGIENCLHWVLDVTFNEDASRIRKNHAPENFALLRHLALNLLNRDKSVKASLRQKRYRAGLDNNYLVKVITNI